MCLLLEKANAVVLAMGTADLPETSGIPGLLSGLPYPFSYTRPVVDGR